MTMTRTVWIASLGVVMMLGGCPRATPPRTATPGTVERGDRQTDADVSRRGGMEPPPAIKR